MRFIVAIAGVVAAMVASAGPAAAGGFVHGVPAIPTLPDPATLAVMFGGLGLVAGARRTRTGAVAD